MKSQCFSPSYLGWVLLCILSCYLASCGKDVQLGTVTLTGEANKAAHLIAVPSKVKDSPILISTSAKEFDRIVGSQIKVEMSVKNGSSTPVVVGCHIDELVRVTVKSGETKVIYSGLLATVVERTTGQMTTLWFEEMGPEGAEMHLRVVEAGPPIVLNVIAMHLHHPL